MNQLLPGNELTRQNIVEWVEEQVALEPVIAENGTNVANSVERVLRGLLRKHWIRNYLEYDKHELIETVILYIMEGVDCPVNEQSRDELLDEIMQICTPQEDGTNAYELETMDDFVRVFTEG